MKFGWAGCFFLLDRCQKKITVGWSFPGENCKKTKVNLKKASFVIYCVYRLSVMLYEVYQYVCFFVSRSLAMLTVDCYDVWYFFLV